MRTWVILLLLLFTLSACSPSNWRICSLKSYKQALLLNRLHCY
jgi:uncharacterized protein YcfL